MKVVATRVGWPVGDDSKRYLELLLEGDIVVRLELDDERAKSLAHELTVRPPASHPAGVQ